MAVARAPWSVKCSVVTMVSRSCRFAGGSAFITPEMLRRSVSCGYAFSAKSRAFFALVRRRIAYLEFDRS